MHETWLDAGLKQTLRDISWQLEKFEYGLEFRYYYGRIIHFLGCNNHITIL